MALIPEIIPLHVNHKANNLGDRMANEGVLMSNQDLDIYYQQGWHGGRLPKGRLCTMNSMDGHTLHQV